MATFSRKLTITLALVLLGALCGAVVGSLVFVGVVVRQGPTGVDLLTAIEIGSRVGAVVGVLAAPPLGWSALRHVPIGRALLTVVLWPLAGAAVGWLFSAPLAVPLAFVGLMAGVAWAARRPRSEAEREG
jgi:hypothetical protein